MDPFLKFLAKLSMQLDLKEWQTCADCYEIPNQRRQEFQSASDFFVWLRQQTLLDRYNFQELKGLMDLIGRKDLIKRIEDFQGEQGSMQSQRREPTKREPKKSEVN